MTPGECQYEVDTILIGTQVKSLCTLRGHAIWTNCRHHGRCTLAHVEADDPQLRLFDGDDDATEVDE